MKILRVILAFFLDIIETIVVAASLFVIVYLFLLQPHQVIGNSMLPNYYHNEFILTDKISYRFRHPQRGEVVVFKSPENKEKDFIKRVIGLPGERILIYEGKVYIDGKLLSEDYLGPDLQTLPGKYIRENQEITIRQDTYLVLGDNRLNSSDSRAWGTVPVKDIIGRALLVYWPPNLFRLVKEIHYR